MFIRSLFVALILAATTAGVLSAANKAWPPGSQDEKRPVRTQSEPFRPSR